MTVRLYSPSACCVSGDATVHLYVCAKKSAYADGDVLKAFPLFRVKQKSLSRYGTNPV